MLGMADILSVWSFFPGQSPCIWRHRLPVSKCPLFKGSFQAILEKQLKATLATLGELFLFSLVCDEWNSEL